MNKLILTSISFLLPFIIAGCTIDQKGFVQPNKQNSSIIKESYVKDNIQLKLINEDNQLYNLEDVIIGYNTHPFEVMDNKAINETFTSTNDAFNKKYGSYSVSGLQESFLGVQYMKYTDEALLAMLADEYGMKLILMDTQTKKIFEIDFKNSNLVLPKEIRHNIYYGFIDTLNYYKERENDK